MTGQDGTSGVSRRGLLAGATVTAGAMAAGAATGLGGALTAPERAAAAGRRAVGLRQGTDVAPQVSPDGKLLAIDVLGVLWVLPAGGGTARRLTSDLYDVAQPDWSPDSGTLAFQSYRDGTFQLWTARPDGTGIHQLTSGVYDHREPRWSPDGSLLAFSADSASGSYGVYTYQLATGAVRTVADTADEEYEPAWSPDGSELAFVAAGNRIDIVEVATGNRRTAVTVPAGQAIHGPAFTPDGTALLYHLASGGTVATTPAETRLMRSPVAGGTAEVLVSGEDVFPFRPSWLPGGDRYVYAADGVLRSRALAGGAATQVPFTAQVTTTRPAYRKRQRDFDSTAPRQVVGVGSPALSPDGQRVAFRALNDLWTARLGQPPVALTRDAFWKSDPAWSPDGRYLSYSSDRAGKLDVWLRDLTAGTDRKVVDLPNAAAVSATWSADGRSLAFLDQTGALYTADVATGDVRPLFTATFEPGRPSWSADGRTIALAAIKPYTTRYREGLSKILLVDVASGAGRYVDPLPDRSIQTRGDDGPVWSPDGTRLAFVVASVLWLLPVAADGTPTGPARQLTTEVTDAPTWSGDGRTLLYLNNGRLRLVDADGGTPRTVPLPMRWANAKPRGRTVVHAGRMWDGTATSLRSDVDIVLDGNRISAVEPHAAGRDGRLVDASAGVVVPGLIDIHNHREMQGYSYGDRQGRLWLSLGITTTRSPGSPAYHMVEERESTQSAARVGPRYFATGEAVDGARIFYNFMRPTFSDAQLALELARAEALDYDLMKAYVRLKPEWQQQVIDFAHRHGVHATSHYHWPAATWGGDGMEHVGATNRFGYSRTISALGAGYSDVAEVFATAGMTRTPTLFVAAALYRDDTSLVDDRRVRTLYPSWEYASLQAAVSTAKTTDQSANLANLARQVAQLRALLDADGTVVNGTDSPIDHTAVSTHMNLRAMVKYGLTPYEAMVSTTAASGTLLGEPVGRLRTGMLADLTVLGGDPLTDITQAANVSTVITNGVPYTVDELMAPFAGAVSESTANRVLPALPPHPANADYWWHDPHWVEASRNACCVDG